MPGCSTCFGVCRESQRCDLDGYGFAALRFDAPPVRLAALLAGEVCISGEVEPRLRRSPTRDIVTDWERAVADWDTARLQFEMACRTASGGADCSILQSEDKLVREALFRMQEAKQRIDKLIAEAAASRSPVRGSLVLGLLQGRSDPLRLDDPSPGNPVRSQGWPD